MPVNSSHEYVIPDFNFNLTPFQGFDIQTAKWVNSVFLFKAQNPEKNVAIWSIAIISKKPQYCLTSDSRLRPRIIPSARSSLLMDHPLMKRLTRSQLSDELEPLPVTRRYHWLLIGHCGKRGYYTAIGRYTNVCELSTTDGIAP